MKKVVLVMRKYGENAPTAGDMVGVLGEVPDYDPNAVKMCCVSYDNDMLIEVKRDYLLEVEVADWFDFNEFRNSVSVKYLFAYGYKWDMGEKVFRKLYSLMGGNAGYWVYLLLNRVIKVKAPRSEFTKSIKAQVEAWLDGAESKYAFPLSPKQFNALDNSHLAIDYKRIANGAYASGSGLPPVFVPKLVAA